MSGDLLNGWDEDGEPMSDLIERLRENAARPWVPKGGMPVLLNEAADALEAKDKRNAQLETIRDAAANLVRAERWQIERDNLWDALHDLIDAEDEQALKGDNDE